MGRRISKLFWWALAMCTLLLWLFNEGDVAVLGRWWGVYFPLGLVAAALFDLRRARRGIDTELARWRDPHAADAVRTSLSALKELDGEGASVESKLRVVVAGRIRCAEKVTAPLSKEKCAGYTIRVGFLTPEDLEAARTRDLPSVVRYESGPLALESEGHEARLEGQLELQLGEPTTQTRAWSSLEEKEPELFAVVKEAMALEGLSPETYTGVFIEESVLATDTQVEVGGLHTRTSEGELVIGGDADAPVLVSSLTSRERQARRQAARRPHLPAVAWRVAVAAVFFGLAAYSFTNPHQHGALWHHSNQSTGRVDLTRGEQPPIWWKLETGDSVDKLTEDGFPVSMHADHRISLVKNGADPAVSYLIGRDPIVQWRGSRWVVDLSSTLPPTATAAAHRGIVRIKNATKGGVRFEFAARKTPESPDPASHWDFDAWEGTDRSDGLRLLSNSKPVYVQTSDRMMIHAATSTQADPRFEPRNEHLFGFSELLRWTGEYWMVDLRPDDLTSRHADIGARNATSERFEIEIADESGAALGTWTFEPNDGTDNALGSRLVIGEKPAHVAERYTVKIKRLRRTLLCNATVAECRYAHFDPSQPAWTIELPNE